MQKVTFLIFTILFSTSILAQENKFETAMKSAIQALNDAKEMNDFQAVANQFERIAQAESNQWLPSYYASYAYLSISFRVKDGDEKDDYLEKADNWLNKSKEIAPQESELFALQAFIIMAKVSISPMTRGMTMTDDFNAAIAKAKALNAENPRIYYLDGQYTMNMPQMFGGGMKNACPLLQTAKEKYDVFETTSRIWPDWGKNHTLQLVGKCSQ